MARGSGRPPATTAPGLLEGRHAGCWTVAVLASGNETGLTLAQWRALSHSEQHDRRLAARRRLAEAAPDYAIDTVAGLREVLQDIERRLAEGERPR